MLLKIFSGEYLKMLKKINYKFFYYYIGCELIRFINFVALGVLSLREYVIKI